MQSRGQGDHFGLRKFSSRGSQSFYRSRSLDAADESFIQELLLLGITDIFDVRKPSERIYNEALYSAPLTLHTLSDDLQDDPAGKVKAFDAVACPIHLNVASYGSPGQRMCTMYRRMALHAQTIALVLRLIKRSVGSVLVHCEYGKDRSGVVCACIKRMNGDSEASVYEDYLLTNEVNRSLNESDLARLSATLSHHELDVMRSMFIADALYLDTFWETIDLMYGSFEQFLESVNDESATSFLKHHPSLYVPSRPKEVNALIQ